MNASPIKTVDKNADEKYKINNYIEIKPTEIIINHIYWNLILQQLNIYISTKSLNEFIKKLIFIKHYNT